MELEKLINSLSALMSVTGHEGNGRAELESLIGAGFDESFTDAVGNRFFVKRCGREGAPKILIDAHMDEIGLIVSDIKDDGFLTVAPIGGVDLRTLQAGDVVIYGKEKIFGVVGSTPPHLRRPDEGNSLKEATELLIDTGYTKEKLSELVRIGTPVGFKPVYRHLFGSRIAGKGFDDKSCAACAVIGISRVAREELAGDVYLMLSSREETGMFGGAAPGAYSIAPDYAMVIDVNLGKTPDTSKSETVAVGGGASLTLCPVTDRTMNKKLIALAKEKEIKTQVCVTGGSTGTNASAVNLAGAGIPCVDVGLPLKGMHTATEVLDLEDAESVAALVALFVSTKDLTEVTA